MSGLPPEELQAVLDKLDELCRQAQELQRQVRKQMRALRYHLARPSDQLNRFSTIICELHPK
jgi:hypothetical protein